MSSQALYRKWRPGSFTEVVGQRVLTKTLSQAVAGGRIAHAYLFCGPRGTGKTSTARVLAKAANCLNRTEGTGEPDGKCPACQAFDQGNFIDLIEIDAASNRGIDEIRSLREKVHFAPAQASMKVYIIDEAHMLTDAAFNAFLKTLEEPPPQTLFILCTTEVHKLPATIISRCQRFDFHRISTADLTDRLRQIANAENVEASPEVLSVVARAASGSLRDATNLLDQLITSYGLVLTLDMAAELLGLSGEQQAIVLVNHLLSGETKSALSLVNAIVAEGADLRLLHKATVEYLRTTLLLKNGVTETVDQPSEVIQQLTELVSRVTLEYILRALRLFGNTSLRYDHPSPLPLELAIVELGLENEPKLSTETPPIALNMKVPKTVVDQASAQPLPSKDPIPPLETDNGAAALQSTSFSHADPTLSTDGLLASQWVNIVRALSRQKGKRFNVGALLNSSKAHFLEGKDLVVRFTHHSNTERLQEELEDAGYRLAIEKVLEDMLGDRYAVRAETDEQALGPRLGRPQGHLVRAAINMGGQVVSEPEPPNSLEDSIDEQEHAETSPADSSTAS